MAHAAVHGSSLRLVVAADDVAADDDDVARAAQESQAQVLDQEDQQAGFLQASRSPLPEPGHSAFHGHASARYQEELGRNIIVACEWYQGNFFARSIFLMYVCNLLGRMHHVCSQDL
jgi:hypothetical protein